MIIKIIYKFHYPQGHIIHKGSQIWLIKVFKIIFSKNKRGPTEKQIYLHTSVSLKNIQIQCAVLLKI